MYTIRGELSFEWCTIEDGGGEVTVYCPPDINPFNGKVICGERIAVFSRWKYETEPNPVIWQASLDRYQKMTSSVDVKIHLATYGISPLSLLLMDIYFIVLHMVASFGGQVLQEQLISRLLVDIILSRPLCLPFGPDRTVRLSRRFPDFVAVTQGHFRIYYIGVDYDTMPIIEQEQPVVMYAPLPPKRSWFTTAKMPGEPWLPHKVRPGEPIPECYEHQQQREAKARRREKRAMERAAEDEAEYLAAHPPPKYVWHGEQFGEGPYAKGPYGPDCLPRGHDTKMWRKREKQERKRQERAEHKRQDYTRPQSGPWMSPPEQGSYKYSSNPRQWSHTAPPRMPPSDDSDDELPQSDKHKDCPIM